MRTTRSARVRTGRFQFSMNNQLISWGQEGDQGPYVGVIDETDDYYKLLVNSGPNPIYDNEVDYNIQGIFRHTNIIKYRSSIFTLLWKRPPIIRNTIQNMTPWQLEDEVDEKIITHMEDPFKVNLIEFPSGEGIFELFFDLTGQDFVVGERGLYAVLITRIKDWGSIIELYDTTQKKRLFKIYYPSVFSGVETIIIDPYQRKIYWLPAVVINYKIGEKLSSTDFSVMIVIDFTGQEIDRYLVPQHFYVIPGAGTTLTYESEVDGFNRFILSVEITGIK